MSTVRRLSGRGLSKNRKPPKTKQVSFRFADDVAGILSRVGKKTGYLEGILRLHDEQWRDAHGRLVHEFEWVNEELCAACDMLWHHFPKDDWYPLRRIMGSLRNAGVTEVIDDTLSSGGTRRVMLAEKWSVDASKLASKGARMESGSRGDDEAQALWALFVEVRLGNKVVRRVIGAENFDENFERRGTP